MATTSGRSSKDYRPRHAPKKAAGAKPTTSRSAQQSSQQSSQRSSRKSPQTSSKRKSRKGFFRRYWWAFALTPVAFALIGFGVLAFAYVRIDLPKALPPIQTTVV